MRDGAFEGALNRWAQVSRARVRVAGDLALCTPTYDAPGGGVRARVESIGAEGSETLVGPTPAATHVIYMPVAEVSAGDRVAVIEATVRLAEGVAAGATGAALASAAGVTAGAVLRLPTSEGIEEVEVTRVEGDGIHWTPALVSPHGAGEELWVVTLYEVVGVADEAGQGHHLKVRARRIG